VKGNSESRANPGACNLPDEDPRGDAALPPEAERVGDGGQRRRRQLVDALNSFFVSIQP
jgi:hypothetical protein